MNRFLFGALTPLVVIWPSIGAAQNSCVIATVAELFTYYQPGGAGDQCVIDMPQMKTICLPPDQRIRDFSFDIVTESNIFASTVMNKSGDNCVVTTTAGHSVDHIRLLTWVCSAAIRTVRVKINYCARSF